MSEPTEVCFIIYCKGKFEITEGVTSYLGGDVSELVCPPQLLFPKMAETLGSSLYGQRIWYKLPYHDYTELKLLCNGNAMFEKMLEATEWCNTVQIFMEKDDDIDDGDGNGSGDNGGSSDRRSGDGVGDNSDEEILEEDARVEKNIEGFVDEEENHNDEVTPENSDCEDDDRHYERYKKGSGVLILGQAFDSLAEFKEAVVDYSLKDGFNVKFTRWGSVKSEVRCGVVAVHEDGNNNGADGNVVAAVTEKDRDGETENQTCPFRIYCSFEKSVGMYLIKTFEDEHSCIPDGYSKVVRGRVIAKLLLNEIRRDPKLKHKAMQEKMEEKYKIIVSNDQCRKAKRQALNIVQDEHDQQFARLKDYKMEVIKCNPESTVEVGTLTNESGKETFDRIYVCLAPLKRTWIAHCRPIFGIDGCFLKSNAQGQFLAAVGRDANNQLFPIAWAVVEIENTDSWLWFIQLLKNDLNLLDGTGFTLISDRQKGLIIAVEQLLPQVEHRMCARHIYGNLRRVYPGKELPKDLFWAVAKSFNNGEYEVSMKALKNFDVRVYEAVLLKNPQNFSRAFFTSTPVCEDVSNNFSESYNNTLNTAREMPLVEMLETVRRQAMVRMDMRKTKALRWQGKYSEKVVNTIKAEKKHLLDCRVIPSGNGIYEVGENNHPHTVDMSAKTCVCRRWSMTGIPCRHALRVILMKKLDPLDYVSHWYLTSTWRQQYNDPIRPVNGINFWRSSDKATIQPPPRDAPQPTKKQKKRIKGKNESPQKKKKGNGSEAPTKKRIKLNIERKTTYCGRCGLGGHNSRKCPNHGCPVNRPKKQPSGLSQGEGPSQASQNSNFG